MCHTLWLEHKKSSPPSEGGVAAASADGVVLYQQSFILTLPNARSRENHPGLEDSATPPSEGGESFFVLPLAWNDADYFANRFLSAGANSSESLNRGIEGAFDNFIPIARASSASWTIADVSHQSLYSSDAWW